ncbi:MAG: hypothetical protein JW959_13460 [Pirellulales bacterium]|nr:hypothetical protein [Pirellulales bacterium]
MQDVDFLPIEYREKYQRRQSQPWQLVAAAAIVGLVAAAAVGQRLHLRRAEAELATIAPTYEAAVKLQNRLAEEDKKLDRATARAELIAYLRHPWPRTQLLAALLAPLPEEIAFQQVEIIRDRSPAASSNAVSSRTETNEEENRDSLAPAERDMEKIRRRIDPMQTVVVLTGTAKDSAALHRYLSELDNANLFDKAELDSLSGAEDGEQGASVRFRAVLAVRPGYGQPGGPEREIAESKKEYLKQ